MAEASLDSKGEEKTEQKKLKRQKPLLKEMRMLGNRKILWKRFFLFYQKHKCTVF